MTTLPPGLTLEQLPAPAVGEEPSARLRGWLEAQARGFHQGRPGERHRALWPDHLRADEVRAVGIWEEQPVLGSGTLPVATYSSFDKTIHTGTGLVPLRMITDITVSPTHRRQGLLRALITRDLRDAAGAGVPLAALTASEGAIYGRFGFGPATRERQVSVDTSARFALRGAPGGRVVLLEPEEAWPSVRDVFARWHRRTRGSVERPQFYEPFLTGRIDMRSGDPDARLRTAVHLDAAGAADGYVAYRVAEGSGSRTAEVADLAALGPSAHRALWRFLADLDLVGTVTWSHAAVEDPLVWSLVDPRALTVTGERDALWVRVVDVPAALAARPWYADGDVVLEVADPLGLSSGRWRVVTSDGAARVAPTDDEPGVRLEADTLGSLHLGGVTLGTLVAAGRVAGTSPAIATLAAMTTGGPAPHSITPF